MWFQNSLTQGPKRVFMLCVIGLFTSIVLPAVASENEGVSPIMVPNPATDLWRAVRQRELPVSGDTQVRGVETGVLIQKAGEDFRNYRQQDFVGNAALLIIAVGGAIALFYFVRGRINIPDGRSGRRVRRFTEVDRAIHWATAVLFVVLALTGLTLLFGRFVVRPVIGPEAFGVFAGIAKDVHDLASPLFVILIVTLIARFMSKNLFARDDLTWLRKGGGIIGNNHVSAGFFNAGEKIWFWLVTLLGITASISGLVLLFPNFGQGREVMQLALIVHGISAVLFTAGSLGHIYIGTIGTEGSLESMSTGYVDENWAKAHHDRWYGEIIENPPLTDTRSSTVSNIADAALESSATKN